MRMRAIFLPLLLLVGIFVLLAACGDDDDDNDGGTDGGSVDISGVAELEDGTLTVGSDIAYAPIEYYEEGTENAVGLDVDIMTAIGDELGVEVEFEQVADFAGIIGDLNSSRYDTVMSAISITDEREAEIDLIPYFGPAGTGILVPTGNPEGITGLEDLCGRPVSAQVGTIQVDYMNELNENECADNQIEVKEYPDTPTAIQELTLGRVEASLADDPVAAYAELQSEGEIELVFTGFDSATYGIGVRKDSTALKTAIELALSAIIADGTYDAILEEWNLSTFAYEG